MTLYAAHAGASSPSEPPKEEPDRWGALPDAEEADAGTVGGAADGAPEPSLDEPGESAQAEEAVEATPEPLADEACEAAPAELSGAEESG